MTSMTSSMRGRHGRTPARPAPATAPRGPGARGPGRDAPTGVCRPRGGVQQGCAPAQGLYVRVFSNDYSVDPSAIGRLGQVTADLDAITATASPTVLRCEYRTNATRRPPG